MKPMFETQVNDIKVTRIDFMLKEMSETMLCDLPDRQPWSVPTFLATMEVLCSKMYWC